MSPMASPRSVTGTMSRAPSSSGRTSTTWVRRTRSYGVPAIGTVSACSLDWLRVPSWPGPEEVSRTTARPLKSAIRNVTRRASTHSASAAATASTASIGARDSTRSRNAPTSNEGAPDACMPRP